MLSLLAVSHARRRDECTREVHLEKTEVGEDGKIGMPPRCFVIVSRMRLAQQLIGTLHVCLRKRDKVLIVRVRRGEAVKVARCFHDEVG